MALLDTYHDPGLEVDLAQTPEQLAAAEVERLQSACAVLAVTAAIPRRLSDATSAELALDKRRARRCLHVERQCLAAWGGAEREPTDEERRAGAQLRWELWSESAQSVLQARLRYFATWSKKTGQLRFGKSAIVRLSQEADWLGYALRD